MSFLASSLARVAPDLGSYEASEGVLSHACGAKGFSPQTAADVATQLDALKALRQRMVEFGHG